VSVHNYSMLLSVLCLLHSFASNCDVSTKAQFFYGAGEWIDVYGIKNSIKFLSHHLSGPDSDSQHEHNNVSVITLYRNV